ncbi:MAG: hypothetical protein AB1807_10075 [Pseudomonadota bacterium]
MTLPHPNSSLVTALRARFPEEAALTDHWLRERGWDPADENTALSWVEAFADRTNEAVRRRDAEGVRAQTGFIAAAYRANPDALRVIVDVSYAENLLRECGAQDKRWAWRWIAADIRQLFVEMWGDPTVG